MKPKLFAEIKPDGSTKIWVEGAKGNECLAMTAEIEKELGTVTERRRTCGAKPVEAQQTAKQGA